MLLWTYEEDIKQISLGSTNHNNFLAFFVGSALRLEKVCPTWINFKIVQTISRSGKYVNIDITIATEFWHPF